MHTIFRSRAFAALSASILTASGLLGAQQLATGKPAGGVAEPVFTELLPNAPGKRLTVVRVTYAPGAKSASHAHSGSVFAYVLSGKIRSENSVTGPAKVYSAGEGFFEPSGSVHRVSENASDTEPASLLAIFVAEDGATLTKVGSLPIP
ncbi:MAG: cupin domain-containing protein [Steroidobacteraceae bacterium]|nr:cupin domain-containing protein [Steroidobacteraceae bacterium]